MLYVQLVILTLSIWEQKLNTRNAWTWFCSNAERTPKNINNTLINPAERQQINK